MQLDLNIAGPLSVSELTRRIKDTIELRFADVWVQGEITGLRIPSSGHLYFSLKDRDTQIKAVFFRASTRFLKFQPKDGLEVIARGRVSVYEPRGEYQIVLEYMEPVGLGALQLALIQLKEKLGKEGLFDEDRKKALPAYPKCVGVVTSPTGAAIRDILKVLKRRAPGVRVIISPASVQGENAPQEIARAILNLNEQAEADVIIVGRGGGSMEDLMAFNTETVARAIASSRIPTISAVGHEVDFTVADFVADHRAPTPSAAAEIVASSEEETRDKVGNLQGRLARSMGHSLRHAMARLSSEERALPDMLRTLQERGQRLDDSSARLVFSALRGLEREKGRAGNIIRALGHLSPARRLQAYTESFSGLSRRLRTGTLLKVQSGRQRFESAAVRLAVLEPLAPLARGFAVAMKMPGEEILKDAAQVEPGDTVRLKLNRGGLDCKVEKKL
jgi:exodeoxyribonuclease VII large subunit